MHKCTRTMELFKKPVGDVYKKLQRCIKRWLKDFYIKKLLHATTPIVRKCQNVIISIGSDHFIIG